MRLGGILGGRRWIQRGGKRVEGWWRQILRGWTWQLMHRWIQRRRKRGEWNSDIIFHPRRVVEDNWRHWRI